MSFERTGRNSILLLQAAGFFVTGSLYFLVARAFAEHGDLDRGTFVAAVIQTVFWIAFSLRKTSPQ